MRCLDKSNQHFRKANTKLPLGVSSNFRYWGDDKTIYVQRAKGGRIWDIDGNEYIDYRLGYGPAILGYADSRVDDAARQGMDVGGVFALATELEYEVACRISKMVPAAELVRFSNSGTEAVMAALRIARAHTGKDGHIVMEGGYHGVFNEVLWYTEVEEWTPSDGDPEVLPYGEGVPAIVKPLFHSVPLNDANTVEDVMRKHHNDIGAFLIEPIMGNCCAIAATREYLQAVRELCDRYNVVLVVDEVKTGFRVAKGGAQELFGVRADICTFAKAMGNGHPLGAVITTRAVADRYRDQGYFFPPPAAAPSPAWPASPSSTPCATRTCKATPCAPAWWTSICFTTSCFRTKPTSTSAVPSRSCKAFTLVCKNLAWTNIAFSSACAVRIANAEPPCAVGLILTV